MVSASHESARQAAWARSGSLSAASRSWSRASTGSPWPELDQRLGQEQREAGALAGARPAAGLVRGPRRGLGGRLRSGIDRRSRSGIEGRSSSGLSAAGAEVERRQPSGLGALVERIGGERAIEEGERLLELAGGEQRLAQVGADLGAHADGRRVAGLEAVGGAQRARRASLAAAAVEQEAAERRLHAVVPAGQARPRAAGAPRRSRRGAGAPRGSASPTWPSGRWAKRWIRSWYVPQASSRRKPTS